jgi:glycolate oxidase FAD binding subunit
MSAIGEKLLGTLTGIAGEENTSVNAPDIARYVVDGLAPQVVVRPGSAEEIAEIFRLCAADKLAVIPAGSGTKLRMGGPPTRYDVALVLTRMARVHAYDAGDLTLSVGPGARLADLATLLEKQRQFLPLAVPFAAKATIGGTVASGIDSPLRQGYGTTRDFLLGAEFVTGTATIAKSGGRVVKNVAGYDLHKLFIGSLGTLGVLTRLNFKTFPLPESSRMFLVSFAGASGALDLVERIVRSPIEPSSLDILSPSLAQLFGGRAPSTDPGLAPIDSWLPSPEWVVAAGFGGGSAALQQRVADEMARMAAEAKASGTVLLDDKKRPAFWGQLREAVPLLLDASPGATILRIGVLPKCMGEIFTAAQSSAERHGLPLAILARAAGAIYAAFLPEKVDEDTLGRLALAANEMSEAAAAAPGFSSILYCPAQLKGKTTVWGRERADLGLMRKVKQVFDPEGILSPGRFVGGI